MFCVRYAYITTLNIIENQRGFSYEGRQPILYTDILYRFIECLFWTYGTLKNFDDIFNPTKRLSSNNNESYTIFNVNIKLFKVL